MTASNLQNCLICESSDYNEIFSYGEPDQYERSMGINSENYFRKWVQCTDCGFYYSIYSRHKGIINNLYTESYRSLGSPWRTASLEDTFKRVVNLSEDESENKQKIKWVKNNIELLKSHEIIKDKQPPYSFLDIGGGSGVFVYEFRDENWDPHVIDPSIDKTFFEERLKIKFIKSHYKPGLFNIRFDLISMIYLLEHLEDPISMLKSAHQDMNKESLLYLEVPDALSFIKKPSDDDIFNSAHLWMFNPKSLEILLDKCGFEVLSLSRLRTKRSNYALMAISSNKMEVG